MQAVVFQQNRVIVGPVSARIRAALAARIAICLVAALLCDAMLCLMVSHPPVMQRAQSAVFVSSEPVRPTSERAPAPLSDALTCQHTHCSMVLLVVSLLILPLLRRTPIMLPAYALSPQITIAPLLPPP